MKQQITHMASLTCRTTGKYVPSCSVYRNCHEICFQNILQFLEKNIIENMFLCRTSLPWNWPRQILPYIPCHPTTSGPWAPPLLHFPLAQNLPKKLDNWCWRPTKTVGMWKGGVSRPSTIHLLWRQQQITLKCCVIVLQLCAPTALTTKWNTLELQYVLKFWNSSGSRSCRVMIQWHLPMPAKITQNVHQTI